MYLSSYNYDYTKDDPTRKSTKCGRLGRAPNPVESTGGRRDLHVNWWRFLFHNIICPFRALHLEVPFSFFSRQRSMLVNNVQAFHSQGNECNASHSLP